MGSFEGAPLPNSGSEGGNNYSAGTSSASGAGVADNYGGGYGASPAANYNWNSSADIGWDNPASSLKDFNPSNDDWYAMKSGVGWGEENDRADVAKVQSLLGATEHYDVAGTDGPTGYMGTSFAEGIKEFQKQNGLADDGVVKRDGPTLKALKGKTGHIFGEYPSPTIDEIDAHHESLAKENKPLLQHRPPVPKLQPLEHLPKIDDEDHGAIGRSVKYLTNYSDPGGHPEDTARIIRDVGDYGIAYARELVSQLQKADADLGNKYLTSLAGLLKPNLQEKFLGGPMPDPIPIGVSLAAVAALDENRKNKLGNSQNEEEYSPDEEAEYEINNGENYSGDGWGDDSTDYGEHGFDSQDLAQAAEDKKDENPASWQDEFSRHQANGEFEQSPSNNPSEAFNRTLFPDHAENSLRDEFDRSILNQDFEEQRQEREKTGFRYGQTLALKKDKLIGDTSPLRKIPTLTKENQKIRDDLKMITTIGRISGRDVAATLGLHYLTGNGEPVELADLEKLRGYRPVRDGEARVERFIEGTLSGKNTPRIKEPLKKNIEAFAKSDQKEMHVKDKFEGSFLFSPNLGSGQRDIPIALSDMANAIGSGTIEGVTDITLTRKGNTIEIDGQVEYRLRDRYDFAKGKGTEDERLPQGWLALNPNLRRSHIQKLEDAGGVMPFDVTSTPWRKTISGVLNVDNNGDIIKSGGQITKFQWRDIN